MDRLPPDVAIVVDDLLTHFDRHLPGSIEGVYLVGSVALGDYRAGLSDIDFITVVAPGADLGSLSAIHAAIATRHRAVHCDGIYLTRGELASPPAGLGPSAREGIVSMASDDERHPVTWLTLLERGVAIRGPEPHQDWIAADRAAVAAFSRENLQSYWRPWLDRRRRLLRRGGVQMLLPTAVVWGALGVARLHAAVTTQRVLAKSAAAHHALAAFPRHAPIIREALRLRTGTGAPVYRSALARRHDLIAFMDAAIAFER